VPHLSAGIFRLKIHITNHKYIKKYFPCGKLRRDSGQLDEREGAERVHIGLGLVTIVLVGHLVAAKLKSIQSHS